MASDYKSVTVVTKAPAKYRIAKYDSKGNIVEERWANTQFRADEEARDLGGKGRIINERT